MISLNITLQSTVPWTVYTTFINCQISKSFLAKASSNFLIVTSNLWNLSSEAIEERAASSAFKTLNKLSKTVRSNHLFIFLKEKKEKSFMLIIFITSQFLLAIVYQGQLVMQVFHLAQHLFHLITLATFLQQDQQAVCFL